jgi:hypothetical protein
MTWKNIHARIHRSRKSEKLSIKIGNAQTHSDVLADTKARSATTRMVKFVTVGWLSDGRSDVITVSTASQTALIAACIALTDVGQTSETQT